VAVPELALWVYGVLDGDAGELPAIPGVDCAHPAEAIRHAGLVAVASRVPLPEFGEVGLRERLDDLGRLEALARGHEAVLDAALRCGAVVPFRLCTIYESAIGVREMLARERETLESALRRLRGMTEWGVKAYVVAGEPAPAAAPATGVDYLARKRADRDAAAGAREAWAAAAEHAHAHLSALAADAVLSPPQDRRLSGRDEEMVLNAAYLVAEADAANLRALVQELADLHRPDGIALELTGPWPAYHFSKAAA
jgi:hypothetical protein